MKLLYLRTSSFQCDPHVGSILQLAEERGWFVSVLDYFKVKDPDILNHYIEHKFDVMIWLGTVHPDRTQNHTFKILRENGCKTIFLCPEASNIGWHQSIIEFKRDGCFDLMVNLDGLSPKIEDVDIYTTLAIYDQRPYVHLKPWHERPIDIGFCGGGTFRRSESSLPLSFREQLIAHLRSFPNFKELEFVDQSGTYQKYADFMMDCKIAINCSGSGGDLSNHVKGRVLEAGLAGCLLLEDIKSPIDRWFKESSFRYYPNIEYLDKVVAFHLMQVGESSKIAQSLNEEVRTRYNPSKLWDDIFRRVNAPIIIG